MKLSETQKLAILENFFVNEHDFSFKTIMKILNSSVSYDDIKLRDNFAYWHPPALAEIIESIVCDLEAAD